MNFEPLTPLVPPGALFVTVSGAHLYGFESPDSDVDLRGCFCLPLEEVVGLRTSEETLNRTFDHQGLEIDLVLHDVLKFCRLLVKRSGEVLEQLLSDLVVWQTPALEELRQLARPLVVRHFYYHYRGFLGNQLKFIDKPESTVKEMLYGYRVALTGIHLMRTGELQANLPHLLVDYPQDGVQELIARKRQTQEHGPLESGLRDRHRARLSQLERDLAQAFEESPLPDQPQGLEELHQFVLRVRLAR